MKENILLIHVHSFRNSGDSALTTVTLEQLYKHFPTSTVRIIMNDPESFSGNEQTLLSFISWVKMCNHFQILRYAWLVLCSLYTAISFRLFLNAHYLPCNQDLNETIKAFVEANLIVSTPGGYLYSYGNFGRKGTVFIYLYTLALAIILGKPLYLFPQSIGPLNSLLECIFVKWIIKHAKLVMLREEVSLTYLANCGISNSEIKLIPDLAFGYKGESEIRARDWLQSQGIELSDKKPILGITVIDWGAQFTGFFYQQQYEDAIIETINHFISQIGGHVIILPQCWGPSKWEDDRIPAERITNRIVANEKSITNVKTPLSPRLLYSVIGQLELLIGTRMHSNIFAVSQGVPVIMIGYLPKTIGIANMIGISDWVINIQEVEAYRFINLLSNLWMQREIVKSQICLNSKKLRQQTQLAGKFTADNYFNLIHYNEYE